MSSLEEKIQWPARSGSLQLASNEIHVWAAPLNVPATILKDFAATLSTEEKNRAAKFRFERHQNRFVAARGLLREILGAYLQIRPGKLDFLYSTNGKPNLAAHLAGAGIYFNLAHSDDLALTAVTRIGPVGVDVECIRPVKDVEELVARFFSRRENEAFKKVSADAKPAAFFNLWTRKEALLKATGEGITRSLKLVEVSFLPGEPARLLAISGDAARASEWNLHDFSPATGFVGAVAIQARDTQVHCGKWKANK